MKWEESLCCDMVTQCLHSVHNTEGNLPTNIKRRKKKSLTHIPEHHQQNQKPDQKGEKEISCNYNF